MRVALGQFAAGLDAGENREAVRRTVALAGRAAPDLVVLPEAAMHEFGPPGTDLAPVAEPLDGPFVTTLAEAAAAAGAPVVAGMFERREAGLPSNTVVAVGPDGTLLAAYRKIHLYDAFGDRESDQLAPGDPAPVTFEVGGVRVGLMTCYDLRFPELARVLVDAGAQCLVVPSAWVRGPLKEQQWATLLAARALDSTVWVAAAGQNGADYCGRSALVDPLGVVVAGLGEQDGVAVGEVDLDRLADVRRRLPVLRHRRFSVVPGPPLTAGG